MWWAVFTTMPLLMLKDPEPHNVVRADGSVLTDGFKQLGQTLRGLERTR